MTSTLSFTSILSQTPSLTAVAEKPRDVLFRYWRCSPLHRHLLHHHDEMARLAALRLRLGASLSGRIHTWSTSQALSMALSINDRANK